MNILALHSAAFSSPDQEGSGNGDLRDVASLWFG